MHYSNVIVSLLPFVTAHRPSHAPVIERDVAIIGGGSAGTYAAIALKDRHKSVIVIEKEGILGGHTDTYTDKDNGKHVNVGVQVLHNIPLVKQYVSDRLGVPLTVSGLAASDSINANFDNGQVIQDVPPANPQDLVDAIQRYIPIYRSRFPYLEETASAATVPFPVPDELLLSFPDWANQNNVTALVPLAHQILQNVDNLFNTTAVHVLKDLPPSLVLSVLNGFYVIASGDHQDMYTAAAKQLSGDVLYNSVPRSIKRLGKKQDRVHIKVTTPEGQKTIIAKKLIITVAPLIENLGALDLSSDEKALFSKWNTVGYFAGVIQHAGITTVLNNFNPANPFGFATLPGLYNISPNVAGKLTFYGAALYAISTPDAQQLLLKQISTLEAGGVIPPAETEVLFFTNHSPYQLRVDAQSTKDGFYRDLYGLQGKRSTFWTGATWAAHDSSLIWTYTEREIIPSVIAALEK